MIKNNTVFLRGFIHRLNLQLFVAIDVKVLIGGCDGWFVNSVCCCSDQSIICIQLTVCVLSMKVTDKIAQWCCWCATLPFSSHC